MKQMILVGGGEIGGPCPPKGLLKTPLETLAIDKHFISLTQKKNPTLLFLPTATENHDLGRGYEQAVRNYFGSKLGAQVDVLYLVQETPTYIDIKKKISQADCIYVGGGDTKLLLDYWKKTGTSSLIEDFINQGKPVGGVSAGAICWFDVALSNYRKLRYGEKNIAPINGLGIIPGWGIAHYHREESVPNQVKKIMLEYPKEYCWAIDDFAALCIEGDTIKGMFTDKNSCIYKISSHKGEIEEKIIFSGKERTRE